jgi:hypothetical protein
LIGRPERANRARGTPASIGVRPAIPVSRTLAGVRAGRDELLDRALAVVQGRMERRAAAVIEARVRCGSPRPPECSRKRAWIAVVFPRRWIIPSSSKTL